MLIFLCALPMLLIGLIALLAPGWYHSFLRRTTSEKDSWLITDHAELATPRGVRRTRIIGAIIVLIVGSSLLLILVFGSPI